MPTFVNAGTRTFNNPSSLTIGNLPASRVNGNLLLAIASWRIDSPVNCSSAGWTKFGEHTYLTGGDANVCAIFYTYVDGSETAPVFTRAVSATNSAVVLQFSGVATSDPIGASASSGGGPGSSLPSITTTEANSLGLYILATRNNAFSSSEPSGYTEYVDPAAEGGIVVGGKAYPTAGTATGAINFPVTPTAWAGFNLELKGYTPPPSGGKIKYRTSGSIWVAKPVKYWNGTSWVTKPLKFWNGTAWVTTSY